MLRFKRYHFQGDGTKVAWVFGTTFLVNKNSNVFFQVGGVTFLSLLNYVPTYRRWLCVLSAYMPLCLKLLRAYAPTCLKYYMPMYLRELNYYVLTCLRALIFHVATCSHISRTYVLTCLYIFFMPIRLHALNYFIPMCAHFSRACVPATTHKIYWGSLLYLVLLFFLDYLAFPSIQNPKTNSCL